MEMIRLRTLSTAMLVFGWVISSIAIGGSAYLISTRKLSDKIASPYLDVGLFVVLLVFSASMFSASVSARALARVNKDIITDIVPSDVAHSIDLDLSRRLFGDTSKPRTSIRSRRLSALPRGSEITTSGVSSSSVSNRKASVQSRLPSIRDQGATRDDFSDDDSYVIIPDDDMVYFKIAEKAGILVMDVVGFTTISSRHSSEHVLGLVHRLFLSLDALIKYLDLFKYETVRLHAMPLRARLTPRVPPLPASLLNSSHPSHAQIGDCLIAMSNAFEATTSKNHCVVLLALGITATRVARLINVTEGESFNVRVGLHLGQISGGVVGTLKRRLACIGDAMNTASRMESTGTPGGVQVSEEFFKELPSELAKLFDVVDREVRGKGMMRAYSLDVDRHIDVLGILGMDITAMPSEWNRIMHSNVENVGRLGAYTIFESSEVTLLSRLAADGGDRGTGSIARSVDRLLENTYALS